MVKEVLNIISENEDRYISGWETGKLVNTTDLFLQTTLISNYIRFYYEHMLYYNEITKG